MADDQQPRLYLTVSTTLPTREHAGAMAQALIGESFAACVQISGPVISTFRWNDTMETAEEWLCTMKTRSDILGPLEKRIAELHPYEVPEIIATPIVYMSASYLQWLESCLPQPLR